MLNCLCTKGINRNKVYETKRHIVMRSTKFLIFGFLLEMTFTEDEASLWNKLLPGRHRSLNHFVSSREEAAWWRQEISRCYKGLTAWIMRKIQYVISVMPSCVKLNEKDGKFPITFICCCRGVFCVAKGQGGTSIILISMERIAVTYFITTATLWQKSEDI